MPDKADAHADTSGFRIAEEEICGWIADKIDAGTAAAKEDIAVFASIAGVTGVDAIAPQLEAGFEDMLAASDRYTIIELNDSVGEVLLYNLAADVSEPGTTVGLGRLTAAEAKQQQAGAAGVAVRDSEVSPQITNAGIEGVSVEKRNPARSKAGFVQYAWTEGMGPRSNHVVDRSLREGIAQDQQRVA